MLVLDPAEIDQRHGARPLDARLGEVLQRRMKFLSDEDRLAVELVYQHNLPLRKVGVLIHLSAGSVARKLRRIVNRLHDPVVVALLDTTCTLAPDYREMGIHFFLHGRSIPELMKRRGSSRREIEQMIEFVRGWYRGMSQGRP